MKYYDNCRQDVLRAVTLRVRVWIEIIKRTKSFILKMVTLSVRVWIEIPVAVVFPAVTISHPQCEGVD